MRWNEWSRSPELRNAFGQEFDRVREVPELTGKIRKFGSRYYGIQLVASNVAQLALRKRQK